MKTTVNDLINAREWVSEIDNLLNPGEKPLDMGVRYVLVPIVFKLYNLQLKDMAAGQYYCFECSREYGYDVYHNNSNSLLEAMDQPLIKKHRTQIARLSQILF